MAGPRVLLYDFPGSICCQMVRLTLAEKGVVHQTQTVDIMNGEQFEQWYVVLNPKAVVPTLAIDDDITVDTKAIVAVIDARFDGPPLSPEYGADRELMRRWMDDIMGLHYGVLLYSRSLAADRTSSTVVSRGEELEQLLGNRPSLQSVLEPRIAGNRRFQELLKSADDVQRHVDTAHDLVRRFDRALSQGPFVAGPSYTLADPFATAALARFELHGYAAWWEDGSLSHVGEYYERMQARPSWDAAGVINRE